MNIHYQNRRVDETPLAQARGVMRYPAKPGGSPSFSLKSCAESLLAWGNAQDGEEVYEVCLSEQPCT